jgi:hypothetical protein
MVRATQRHRELVAYFAPARSVEQFAGGVRPKVATAGQIGLGLTNFRWSRRATEGPDEPWSAGPP